MYHCSYKGVLLIYSRYKEILLDLELQKSSLQKQLSEGIIDLVGVAEESKMIDKKEFAVKKQLVDSIHITDSGAPRTITSHSSTPSYPNGYVYTKLKGGKIVKSKDVVGLYDKLFSIYFGKLDKIYSVNSIFEKALKEKEVTENPKSNTLIKYRADYKRFINEDLSKKSIVEITEFELKEYTQDLVHSMELKKKSFLAYKGLLNLIFGYAVTHDIISKNPVNKINNSVYLKSCDCSSPKPEDKIFTVDEIQALVDEIKRRMDMDKYGDYYIHGYMARFAILTGARVGELCALKWDDVDFEKEVIHIHAQQLTRIVNGHVEYYYAPYTKNERGVSNDGRYFPLIDPIRDLLLELQSKQNRLCIRPVFVFSHEDGEVVKTRGYETFLRRLCRSIGLSLTNNHTFRMSLNSNVFIQNGISVTDRAMLLGHSVETNLKHYSYAHKDCVDNAKKVLNNALHNQREPLTIEKEPSVIKFSKNKNAPKLATSGHF